VCPGGGVVAQEEQGVPQCCMRYKAMRGVVLGLREGDELVREFPCRLKRSPARIEPP
jgi:hypothetical protein